MKQETVLDVAEDLTVATDKKKYGSKSSARRSLMPPEQHHHIIEHYGFPMS